MNFSSFNSYCQQHRESRDSSATRIFLKKKKKKKKKDDATSDPETNYKVLVSSLISFSWKKNVEILAQKPSLNGLPIGGDQNLFAPTLAQEIKNGF